MPRSSLHVSDDEIIAKIVCTLPDLFKHMESAWDSMPMNEKTIDALRARLVQEERKIKRRKPESSAAGHSNDDGAFIGQ